MGKQILKRLLAIVPLLFMISFIVFFIINLLPGDATISMAADGADQAYIDHLRAVMGLDKPPIQRYFSWLWGLLHGNFGNSLITNVPVAQTILQRLPVTLEITIVAIIISIIIAVPLGILSAVKRNSIFDIIGSIASMISVALPSFWLGILLILAFAVKLQWLPATGYVSFKDNPIQNLRSVILPAISIGSAFAATVMRQTRSALLETMDQDYIMTAWAKGLRERIVIWKHALRNALIPVVTVVTMQIGRLIGGAAVTETVFAIPGIGRSIVDAILTRDYPLAMGMILTAAVFVVVINTLVDIVYILIDPRISSLE